MMYQPGETEISLVIQFLKNPQDPLLQKQIAAFKAQGPAQENYVNEMLEAWERAGEVKPHYQFVLKNSGLPFLEEEAAILPGQTASPTRLRAIWRWTAGVAAATLLAVAGTWYYQQQAVQELTYTNHSRQVDSLILADGTKVFLNKGAVVRYPSRFKGSKREVALLSGEAYFDINPNAAMPFEVKLDEQSAVKVLGTTFNIFRSGTFTEVYVSSGKVALTAANGEEAVLTANMEGVLRDQNSKISVRTLEGSSRMAWKTGKLYFDNLSMADVLTAIERYYGVKFDVKYKAILHEKLTADFEQEGLEHILLLIEQTYDVHIITGGDNTYIIQHK